MQTIVKAIATCCYLGYLPGPKGTYASLVALLAYWVMDAHSLASLVLTLCLLVLGFLVAGRAEELLRAKDARQIIIDDAAGMLLALSMVPRTAGYMLGAFVLYRAIDILKIPPARQCENLKGSLGIMLDDIVAGIMTNIVIHGIRLIV